MALVEKPSAVKVGERRACTRRVNLMSESVAVEASVSVFLVCVLLLGCSWAVSGALAVAAGLLGAVALQMIRLFPGSRSGGDEVDELGVGIGAPELEEGLAEDDSWTPFSACLAAIAIPFVAAYVVLRLLLLYVVPIGIVAGGAAMSDTGWLRAGLLATVCVLVSVAHELAVVRPLARRYGVDVR